MTIKHIVVTIGCGAGCSAGITEDNELMINYSDNNTTVTKQIFTNVKSQQELHNFILYLKRLEIHLPA